MVIVDENQNITFEPLLFGSAAESCFQKWKKKLQKSASVTDKLSLLSKKEGSTVTNETDDDILTNDVLESLKKYCEEESKKTGETNLSTEAKRSAIIGVYQGFKASLFKDVHDITSEELIKMKGIDQEKKIIIVDTRKDEQHRGCLLPESILLSNFLDQINQSSDSLKDCVVIMVSTLGIGSGKVLEELLKKQQIKDSEAIHFYNLRGGILDWLFHGYPLTTRDGKKVSGTPVSKEEYKMLLPDENLEIFAPAHRKNSLAN